MTSYHHRTGLEILSRDGSYEDEKSRDKDDSLLLHLSADERREVYKSQTETALRRRKEQLREANFVLKNKERVDSNEFNNPHAGPVLRRFSVPRKNHISCAASESYQNYARPDDNNDIRVSKKDVRLSSSSHEHYVCTGENQIPTNGKVVYRSANGNQIKEIANNTVKSSEGTLVNLDPVSAPTNIDEYGANEMRDRQPNNFDDDAHTENSSTYDRPQYGRVNTAEEFVELVEDKKKEMNANPLNLSIDWEDTSGIKKFVMDPCPKSAGMVQCFVKRHSGMKAKMLPEYRVYLKDGSTFLMTSRKRAKKQSSNYLISLGRNDHDKNSANMIGKLRSNFIGTEFQIYDNGKSPKTFDPFFDEKNEEVARRELGCILYTSNILGARGPRKMEVCINKINGNGKSTKNWQPFENDKDMIYHFKGKTETAGEHLSSYENRQPRWNEDMEAYVLNFNKRVTMASVKNFQLIEADGDNEKVIMQFGRTGKDEFSMDVQWPMSLFQAFAISLSSCDSKLACD